MISLTAHWFLLVTTATLFSSPVRGGVRDDLSIFARNDARNDTTLVQCLNAARTAWVAVREHLPASAFNTSFVDTIGVGKRQHIALGCGRRFTLANTPSSDLINLLQLAVFERDTTFGQGVLAALLTDPHLSPRDSATLYTRAGEDFPKFIQQEDEYAMHVADKGSRNSWAYFQQVSFYGFLVQQLSGQTNAGIGYMHVDPLVHQNESRLLAEINQVLQMTETRQNQIDSTTYDSVSFFAEWDALSTRFQQLSRQQADSATIFAHAARAQRDMARYHYSSETNYPGSPHLYDWANLSLLEVMESEMAPDALVARFRARAAKEPKQH